MPLSLDDIVPWGRSFDEYCSMFALSEADLRLRILGCGDGPAAFNSELTRRGGRMVSADPIYQFTVEEIRRRIDETRDTVLAQVSANRNDFVWNRIPSVAALGDLRMQAMTAFLMDYTDAAGTDRYIHAELPALPFGARSFDLAISSHLLFLYSRQRSEAFHCRAVTELVRLAPEVRIFPILDLDGAISPHLEPVIRTQTRSGHRCTVETVAYEFQKGGNQMLRIRAGQLDKAAVGPDRS